MTSPEARHQMLFRALLASRRFPVLLAILAVLLMLPALDTGLMMDDLAQRTAQFKPAEQPPRLLDTGFVTEDSGKLSTVLTSLFGFPRGEARSARSREYGIITWWMPNGLQAALFRPVSSLTHWLDYRWFPNSPALMHAHNILWFAAVVFLAALLYREIGMHHSKLPGKDGNQLPALVAAGVAGCLFLLDPKTYFPVMFVANRGFIVSLVFGLLCLRAHHLWRTSNSAAQMWASTAFFSLALLANEGGASTLAFLLAYALVLERGAWRSRVVSLIPAGLVVLVWRIVYVSCGFGVRKVGGYIDPGYEPWEFMRQLPIRMNALLGGQLTGVPPETSIAFNHQWQMGFILFFLLFNVICAVVFLPVLRKDAAARFWAVATLLALVPAATVAPLSKNMAFVGVGAFGVVASFLVHLASKEERATVGLALRAGSWCVAIWLLIAHIPCAIGGRLLMAKIGPMATRVAAHWCSFKGVSDFGDHRVVIVNNPALLTTMGAPFYRAYYGEPLPKSIDSLVPGSTALLVRRIDEHTLRVTGRKTDLFGCDPAGPVHPCYASKTMTEFLAGGKRWKAGDRVACSRFEANVEAASEKGAPTEITFTFHQPLAASDTTWLFFDWPTGRYLPFKLPASNEEIEIKGPSPLKRVAARPRPVASGS